MKKILFLAFFTVLSSNVIGQNIKTDKCIPQEAPTDRNGEKNGLEISCYSDQSFNERKYINGKRDGVHTYWYDSGQKKYLLTLSNGKFNGLVLFWEENGNESGHCLFKKNKAIKCINLDPDEIIEDF
ncbi:toxin-antitoxin system YwqK family antitoxin [Neisseria sp. Ec49-e6-T10]|uniref:toxin-antitoxin system YwqK family antitoxin n=1 Tax=Neisseria sp. Ec49-e6-T10 TaxID=3140744 RepID=UPI003EBFD04D